jgi:hypothetical protein
MDTVAEIVELLKRFAALCPNAVVARGPFHPDTRPELRDVLTEWLTHYPELRADAAYVAFLEHCLSATAFCSSQNIPDRDCGRATVRGAPGHLGVPDRADRWYPLGWSAVYHGKIGVPEGRSSHGYWFNLQEGAPWGVYHSASCRRAGTWTERRRISGNFTEFLRRLIECAGNPDRGPDEIPK